ncbi:MAG: TrbC/VirB2 family protein [Pseudomonadota bacterium]
MVSFRNSVERALAVMMFSLLATPASAQSAPAPEGAQPIAAAMGWLQGTLIGNIATTAAVIAVAVVGLMMLTGRMNWRHGVTVVFGCFILFGASSIVAGIQSAAAG